MKILLVLKKMCALIAKHNAIHKINKAKVISQCKCGCTIDGRAKDEVRVWSYDPITKEVINS